MAASASIRAFIAIALEPGLIAGLQKIQQELQAKLPGNPVRWVKPEQLHLTLRFLGNVPKDSMDNLAAALHRAAAGVAPLRLVLEGAGCYPNRDSPRVVWVGIRGDLDSLRGLQAQIEQEAQAFGDHTDERVFQPHLTMGRVTAGAIPARKVGEVIERAAVPKLGDWTVRQILLMQSELSSGGARYTTLAAVPLNP